MMNKTIAVCVACMAVASAHAALLTYDIVTRTQTDTAVPNEGVTAGANNETLNGGFGADLSKDPNVNGNQISHAFTFFDATNNVNWGFTLSVTAGAGANIDGTGSGYGIGNAQFDNAGEAATYTLNGIFAVANNAGESATVSSMVIDRIAMNGFTDGQGAYSVFGAGATVTNTIGSLDLSNADSTILLTNLNLGGADNTWRASMVGVNAVVDVIPEPSTLGMIAALGGGILWIRRTFLMS